MCAFLLQLLNAIQLFGANLDDYLHLLLPPIVKLFDAPDVPLQARKSVPHIAISCSHILGSGEDLNVVISQDMNRIVAVPAPQKWRKKIELN